MRDIGKGRKDNVLQQKREEVGGPEAHTVSQVLGRRRKRAGPETAPLIFSSSGAGLHDGGGGERRRRAGLFPFWGALPVYSLLSPFPAAAPAICLVQRTGPRAAGCAGISSSLVSREENRELPLGLRGSRDPCETEN
ncbi:hypothetical protein MTO96_000717 [Rhipicephalus appendiculatus]